MDTLKSFISLLALIARSGRSVLHQPDGPAVRGRLHTIKIASISVAVVVAVSALLGQQIIEFFNISVASCRSVAA